MRARLDGGQIKLRCGKPYTTADFMCHSGPKSISA